MAIEEGKVLTLVQADIHFTQQSHLANHDFRGQVKYKRCCFTATFVH